MLNRFFKKKKLTIIVQRFNKNEKCSPFVSPIPMFDFSSIRKGILEDYHGNETSSFLANSNPRVAFKKSKNCGIIASQRKLFIYIYKYLRKEKDLHFDDAVSLFTFQTSRRGLILCARKTSLSRRGFRFE